MIACFAWVGIAHAAPTTIYQPHLFPIVDSTYDLGSSLQAWRVGYFDQLCLTADSCKTAWPVGGGGGAGTGNVGTSSVPTIGQLSYWTTSGATPELLGKVATSSLTATSPLSLSQPVSVIGSSASALSLSTAGDWTGTIDGNNFAGGAIGSGDLLYGASAGSIAELPIGTAGFILTNNGSSPAWVATTSIPVSGDITGTLSNIQVTDDSHNHTSTSISGLDISSDTNLAVAWPITLTNDTVGFNGLSTSSAIAAGANVIYATGVNTVASAATGTLSATSPLSVTAGRYVIGGSATVAITDAAADGMIKGAASFTAADFNSSSGNISIDYTNGQAANSSTKGFLTSADWTIFNNKVSSTSIDTSAELASLITDETGSAGSLVFSISPTFTGVTTMANSSTTVGSFGYASSTLWAGGGLTDCDADNQALSWDATTMQFVCGDDDNSGGGGAGNSKWATSTVDSAAIYSSNSGKVGVGTTTPWGKLSVGVHDWPTATPIFQVGSSSTGVATSTLFQIRGGGDPLVGIGTTSPYAPLSVVGEVVASHFTGTTTSQSTFGGTVQTPFLQIDTNTTGVSIDTDGDGMFIFAGTGNGSDEDLRLNLDDTANTGVFTSATALDTLTFSEIDLNFSDDEYIGLGASAGRIEFDDLTTDEIVFTGANVGIASSTPSGLLTVQNTGTARTVVIDDAANDTTPFQIDAAGLVTIASTSPTWATEALNVDGNIKLGPNMKLTGSDLQTIVENVGFAAGVAQMIIVGDGATSGFTAKRPANTVTFSLEGTDDSAVVQNRKIRLETRDAQYRCSDNAFHIGGVDVDSPSLCVGDSSVAVGPTGTMNFGIGTSTIPSGSKMIISAGASATTTVDIGALSTGAKTCFNVRNNTGAATSFYFVGTTMVVEAKRCL